ncbi:MAG: GNAT family N-acetyltransferase [Lentisphaeria bacterium]|nr:GNAT family N-acetyltransferase [Lentisphaeria bacterium]
MTDIRPGTEADFDIVMDRVVVSFRERNPGHLRFEELYPDVARSEAMPQWRLAFLDGQLAAGLQLVPRPFVAAGSVRLSGMGLGNVFCYPPFRNRGLMSTLLRSCIEEMERERVPVCLLGGDRSRYGNYGWEHAGMDRSLTLAAGVSRFLPAAQVSAVEIRDWRGDPGDALRLLECYAALPYRTERTAAEFGRVLRRPGHVVWICERTDRGFGYVVVRGGTVLEYAGTAAAVAQLVRFLVQSGSWNAVLPPVEGEGPLEKLLLGQAQHYSVRPTGMVRINAMGAVLEAYMPLLRSRLQAWDGDLALRCLDNGETVRLVGEAGSLRVEDGAPSLPALELSRREMAQLFFGPFTPDVGDWSRHSGLRRLFPLPLHWHALSHV